MSAEAWSDVRKAVWSRGWLRWDELTALEQLVIRYETPAGFEHAAFLWCHDAARGEWLVRPLKTTPGTVLPTYRPAPQASPPGRTSHLSPCP